MKRVHRTKEIDQLQKIKKENEALKREVKQLRKQLDRMPSHRIEALESIAERQKLEAEQELNARKFEKLKEKWQCWECGKGYMRLITMPRRGGVFYLRQCSQEGCGHRTNMKPWHPGVDGVK